MILKIIQMICEAEFIITNTPEHVQGEYFREGVCFRVWFNHNHESHALRWFGHDNVISINRKRVS